MNEIVNKLITLADKKFHLGLFALGVLLLFAGIYQDSNIATWLSSTELLFIARLGALFVVLGVVVWVKGNDYKAASHTLEIEIKKIELDNEIKAKQIALLEKMERNPKFHK